LYFYDVKIQTNIKQNLVEKYVEELQIFKNIFFENFFWTGLDPAHSFWAGPDLFGLVKSGDGAAKKKEEGRTCGGFEEVLLAVADRRTT